MDRSHHIEARERSHWGPTAHRGRHEAVGRNCVDVGGCGHRSQAIGHNHVAVGICAEGSDLGGEIGSGCGLHVQPLMQKMYTKDIQRFLADLYCDQIH